jgi:hypothetical protein
MTPKILKKLKEMNFKIFTQGSYNINIIGIRTPSRVANAFDDFIYVVYKDDDNNWVEKKYRCTTQPGTYWLNNPSRVSGTAILVGNAQYRGVYKLALHQGKYKALCQRGGPVKVYRDSNRDNILDQEPETVTSGYFGINIHRATSSGESVHVNKWSAGCQVIANSEDYKEFIWLCEKSAELYGNSFTYTLLEETEY